MRFSVIIPAHNASNRIDMMLQSIKNQTFHDYEVIVICDACDDNTEEIARQYGARTARIYARSDGVARNTGIEMAQGEWLLFSDDDDWWYEPRAFEMIDTKLKEKECDVLCFSFIWKNRGLMKPHDNPLNKEYWTAVWNKAWRREFCKDVKFPNMPRFSDVYFTKGVFDKKPRRVDWDEPLYYYNYKKK